MRPNPADGEEDKETFLSADTTQDQNLSNIYTCVKKTICQKKQKCDRRFETKIITGLNVFSAMEKESVCVLHDFRGVTRSQVSQPPTSSVLLADGSLHMCLASKCFEVAPVAFHPISCPHPTDQIK